MCFKRGEKDEVDEDHINSKVDEIDSPISRLAVYDESKYQLAKRLIQIFEEKDLKRKHSTGQRNVRDEKDVSASNLYKRIHQIPEEYYYLYNHLSLRYEGTGCLERYISKLRSWEADIHNEYSESYLQNFEISKCWRLHLGSTELFNCIALSLDTEGRLSRITTKWRRLRDFSRKQRTSCLRVCCSSNFQSFAAKFYKMLLRLFYAIYPFIYSSLLFFEVCKNITFACFLYWSLSDLKSGEEFENTHTTFGTILFAVLVCGMTLVQLLFMLISFSHHAIILENSSTFCERFPKGVRTLYRIVSSLIPFSCIMPSFLLANLIRYQEKEHTDTRLFQDQRYQHSRISRRPTLMVYTDNEGLLDSQKPEAESVGLVSTHGSENKVPCESGGDYDYYLYNEICSSNRKRKVCCQIYSQFRMVVAVLESYVAIVVLLLILLDFNDGNGSLSDSIEANVRPFLNIHRQEQQSELSFIGILDYSKTVIAFVFVGYSFLMMATAFVQYVNVHKDEQLLLKGQICLFMYVACHLVTRITATAALFAAPEEFEIPGDGPVMPHFVAGTIGVILLFGQIVLIYFYKHKTISEFKEASLSERIVHVLANTLVVIPFRPAIEINDLENKKEFDSLKNQDEDTNINDQNDDRLASKCGSVYEKTTLGRNLEPLEEKIEEFWWEDPTRQITVEDISNILEKETDIGNIHSDNLDKLANAKFKYLVENGYINKTLHNPRQTKQEYVWLLSIHIFINLVSLAIEFLNGGINTQKGIYVSWDIRIISFVAGLFFLRCYYNFCNIIKSRRPPTNLLKRVQNIGNVLCCKEEKYVTRAIPNDLIMADVKTGDEVDGTGLLVSGRVALETQTSVSLRIKKEDLDKIAYMDEDTGEYVIMAQSNSRPLSPTQKDNTDLNNELDSK